VSDEKPSSALETAEDSAKRGFDRPRVDDSLYEPFEPGQMKFSIDQDGLAGVQLPQGDVPVAPPLTPDTLVCMADTSSFVIRNEWGEVLVTFNPDEVKRAADGRWYVTGKQLRELFEAWGEAPNAAALWLRLELPSRTRPENLRDEDRVEVFPRRPQCKNYARQMTDLQDNSDVTMVERLCTVRRDASGTQFGLRDQQLFACELRSPRDPVSEALLDTFDDGKVKIGRQRLEHEGFAVKSRLEQASADADRGVSYDGIFRRT
jgi:hypothetical protein